MKKLLLSTLIGTLVLSQFAIANYHTRLPIHSLPDNIKSYDELKQKTKPTVNPNPKQYYEFVFELNTVPKDLELLAVNANYWANNCRYDLHKLGIISVMPFMPRTQIPIHHTIKKASDNHYVVRIYDDHWQNEDYLNNGIICQWQLYQSEFIFGEKNNPNHSVAIYQFNRYDYEQGLNKVVTNKNGVPYQYYFDKTSYDTPSTHQYNRLIDKMVTNIKSYQINSNGYQINIHIHQNQD